MGSDRSSKDYLLKIHFQKPDSTNLIPEGYESIRSRGIKTKVLEGKHTTTG